MSRLLWRGKEGKLDRTGLLMLVVGALAAAGAIWRGVPWRPVLFGLVALVCAIQWLRASPGSYERRPAVLVWAFAWLSMTLAELPPLAAIVRSGLSAVGFVLLVAGLIVDRRSARQSGQVPAR